MRSGRRTWTRLLLGLLLTAGVLSQAHAELVAGKNGNCAALWDISSASATIGRGMSVLTCTDGDPTCDADGLSNGVCVINLNACVGEATASCTPGSLSSLTFTPRTMKRLTGFLPPPVFPAGRCGVPGVVSLPLRRTPKNPDKPLKVLRASEKITLVMKSKGFVNKLAVECVPCGHDHCGPTTTTTTTTTTTPLPTTTTPTPTTTTPTTLPLACPLRESPGLPYEITLTVPATGGDLDYGWTCIPHNFPI